MQTWNRWALTSLSRHVFVLFCELFLVYFSKKEEVISCILNNLANFDLFFSDFLDL